MASFCSDNNAGLCPEALDALNGAALGHHAAYGDDAITADAVAAFRALLGHETEVFFVATGTAANTLAIGALVDRWQQVVCHRFSHLAEDESAAPEIVAGCRVSTVETAPDRVLVEDIHRVAAAARGDVHQVQPGVVSLSNPSELGTVYTPADTAAICAAAHDAGYRVHVDGARIANAVAALGCPITAITIDAGVDALSFGGTKNGLAFGEAICLFRQNDGAAFERARRRLPHLRKSTGHLLSKHRFIAAPLAAVLRDGAWLRHAAHANAMARVLAERFIDRGLTPRFRTDVNGVFVELPDTLLQRLGERGWSLYTFGEPAWNLARLLCSFDTTVADIDALMTDVDSVL